MITHSLIVCAFLAFSQVVEASALAADRMLADVNVSETATPQSAILHKDVGLLQGGDTSRDVSKAPSLDAHPLNSPAIETCAPNDACLAAIPSAAKSAQTITDLFQLNENSSGKGAVFFFLGAISFLLVVLLRSNSSTK